MAMNTPVHPGAIVREECLRPLGLSVTEGARRLGIGRQMLSNLVNERASVSIEMAYRLSKAFGSTPETWLGMQSAFDLARSRPCADDDSSVGRRRRQRPRVRSEARGPQASGTGPSGSCRTGKPA